VANLIRNDLIIEGPNVQPVLEFIGFKQPSTLPGLNDIVLIDLYRLGHEFNCKWPMPYGGYLDGDVFEVTDNKASFKFYTKNERTLQIIWALSERFPEYKFTCKTNDVVNGLIAGEVMEGGKQTVFVDVHGHEALVPEVMTEYPLEKYIALATKPCAVPDCSILFPPPTEAELNGWRKQAASEAKRRRGIPS
jgi:hypothetical protein